MDIQNVRGNEVLEIKNHAKRGFVKCSHSFGIMSLVRLHARC